MICFIYTLPVFKFSKLEKSKYNLVINTVIEILMLQKQNLENDT